jgi:hypothetical protein
MQAGLTRRRLTLREILSSRMVVRVSKDVLSVLRNGSPWYQLMTEAPYLLGLYATVDQSNQAADNCNQFLKFDRFGDMHLIARRQRFQTILDPGHRG